MTNKKNSCFKAILTIILPNIKLLVLGSILSSLTSIIILLEPFLAKIVIDNCIIKENLTMLNKFIILYFLLFVFSRLIKYIKDYLFFNITENILKKLRMMVHEAIIYNIDINTKERKNAMAHIMNELPVISNFIKTIFDGLVFQVVSFIIIISYILNFNYKFAIILMIIFIMIFSVLKYFAPRMRKMNKKIFDSRSASLNGIEEDFNNIKLLNYFRVYSYAKENIKEKFCSEINNKFEMLILNFKTDIILSILYFLPSVVVLYIGSNLIIEKKLTIGTLYLLSNYVSKLFSPISFFSQISMDIQSVYVVVERYNDIINCRNIDKVVVKPKIDKEYFSDSIKFKDICFSYSDKMIFKNLNIKIPLQKSIDLKGRNGSGKTTLVDILLGVRDIESGSVEIDGININELSEKSITKLISIIPQEHYFFNKTIKENILLGRNIDESHINDIIIKLGIEEIFDNEFNLNTVVSKNGENLSGGQKQLISVIRGLVSYSSILVLDEPFNHLDIEVKNKLLDYIKLYKKNRTIIRVNHQTIDEDYEVIELF